MIIQFYFKQFKHYLLPLHKIIESFKHKALFSCVIHSIYIKLSPLIVIIVNVIFHLIKSIFKSFLKAFLQPATQRIYSVNVTFQFLLSDTAWPKVIPLNIACCYQKEIFILFEWLHLIYKLVRECLFLLMSFFTASVMIKLDFDSIHSLSVIIKAKKDSEQSLKGEKKKDGEKAKSHESKKKIFLFFSHPCKQTA